MMDPDPIFGFAGDEDDLEVDDAEVTSDESGYGTRDSDTDNAPDADDHLALMQLHLDDVEEGNGDENEIILTEEDDSGYESTEPVQADEHNFHHDSDDDFGIEAPGFDIFALDGGDAFLVGNETSTDDSGYATGDAHTESDDPQGAGERAQSPQPDDPIRGQREHGREVQPNVNRVDQQDENIGVGQHLQVLMNRRAGHLEETESTSTEVENVNLRLPQHRLWNDEDLDRDVSNDVTTTYPSTAHTTVSIFSEERQSETEVNFEEFLQQDEDDDGADSDALYLIYQSGTIDFFRTIFGSSKYHPLHRDEQGNTLLHRIAMYDDVNMMNEMVISYPDVMDWVQYVTNHEGATPFDLSRSHGMKYLMRTGRVFSGSEMFEKLQCKICTTQIIPFLPCGHLVLISQPGEMSVPTVRALRGCTDGLHLAACLLLLSAFVAWSAQMAGEEPDNTKMCPNLPTPSMNYYKLQYPIVLHV